MNREATIRSLMVVLSALGLIAAASPTLAWMFHDQPASSDALHKRRYGRRLGCAIDDPKLTALGSPYKASRRSRRWWDAGPDPGIRLDSAAGIRADPFTPPAADR